MRLLAFKYRDCAVCGTTYDVHRHHIVYRSHSGDDVEANIAPLCRNHHRQIHARDPTTWESLRVYVEVERPDVTEYLERKLGDGASRFFP